MLLVDGSFASGFNYTPGSIIAPGLVQGVAAGQHSFQVLFGADPTHVARSSEIVTLQVVARTLPVPAYTVSSYEYTPVPLGESVTFNLASDCAQQCPPAQYFIDGQYMGGLLFDDDGTSSGSIPDSLNPGPHSLEIRGYGNSTYAASTPNTGLISFSVVDQNLPPAVLTATLVPNQIPEGEYGYITSQINCGTACRGEILYVDGQWSGVLWPYTDGSAQQTISPSLGQGPHSYYIKYIGDSSFSPVATPLVNFNVVPNALPVPIITVHPVQNPVPANVSNSFTVTIANSMFNGPACGGFGFVTANGGWNPFSLDGTGSTVIYTGPQASGSNATFSVQYFGDTNCKQTNSDLITFPVQ
jgi:hypothetical protein